jgi:DsbC/DsbD-like thiol-disulfide interchange protein
MQMKTRTASLALAFAGAFLACPVPPAQARAVKTSADVVKATAKAGPIKDGKQTLTVKLKIDKPYHIYANPVENEDLLDVQTLLTVKGKPKGVKVTYPEGKEHRTGTITYRIYEGEVTLKAEVQRAPEDKAPLQLEIHVQSCTDKRCLLPGTVKLTVK